MNKNITLLWQGQLISQLGTQAYTIAMMFWLMENTGSSALMSIMLTLSILPNVLLGPIAGVIADRLSRKKIIIVTDLIRGFAVLFLSIFILSGMGNQGFIIFLFLMVSLINGLSRTFFQPAIDAFIPDLVPTEKLPKTVAFFQSSTQVTTIIGQALGGLLYRLLGAPLLLLLDAISYFISAFSEFFIKEKCKKPDHTPDTGDKNNIDTKYAHYKADLIAGFHYVKNYRGMFETMLFSSSINFFIAPIMLLLPFYVSEQLLEEAHWYGFLLAAMACGSLLGYGVSATLKTQGHRRAIFMFSAMFFFAASLLLLSQSVSAVISLCCLFIAGFCLGIFNLQSITLFQTATSSDLRGRVMSLSMTISSGLLPVGLLVGGGLGTLTENDTQLIFALCSTSVAVLTLLASINTKIRSFLFNGEEHHLCKA